MKINEIIQGLDRSEKNTHEPRWDVIAREMGIYDSFWTEDKQLVYHYAQQWYCTDTMVGMRVYVLNNVVVAVSMQEARKSEERFFWMNYKIVYDYIHSLYEKEIPSYEEITLDDSWCDGEFFTLEYNSQIMYDKAWYEGEFVDIIRSNFGQMNFHDVQIKHNSAIIMVDCRDLKYRFNQPLKHEK